MGDDDTSLRFTCANDVGQDLGDIFIGEAVKAVAADALIRERPRYGEGRGGPRLRVMEGGVEAGDLRQTRMQPGERRNGGEMMRLMTDYGTQLAASLGAAAMPAGVPGVPGGPGFDALSRSWSDAMQRYNEMLRAMTSGNPTPKT